MGRTAGTRSVPWLLLLLVLSATAQDDDGPAGRVPLDDVWCTVCHWEQGEAFAVSVHYLQGGLLCTDCHGGDPFEPDANIAKGPDSGFIGRPGRSEVAGLCGTCHSGPASFLAQGPHGDPGQRDNPTCVTCHRNHDVVDATLALMDTTCRACHRGDDAALARGRQLQQVLRAAQSQLQATRVRFDSALALDEGLQRQQGRLTGAAAVLRQASPRTHAVDLALVEESLTQLRDELAEAQAAIDEAQSARTWRHRAVAGIWLFVVVNVGLLWRLRRSLGG